MDGLYLSFLWVLNGIEALAGYRHPDDGNGLCFRKFVAEYFPPPYKDWAKKLWSLRNKMVHAFNPGWGVLLSKDIGHKPSEGTPDGTIRLNARDFYDALCMAAEAYFQHLRSSEALQEAFRRRANDPKRGGLLRDVFV
jgi:hypothetical protein